MERINNAIISDSGLILDKGCLLVQMGEKYFTKFINYATVVEIPTPGRPKHFALTKLHAYHEKGGKLIVPLELGSYLQKIKTKDGKPLLTTVYDKRAAPILREFGNFDIPLYQYQEAAIEYLLPILQNADPLRRHVYLQMDTGLGKTRLGVGMIAALSLPTIIIVPMKAIAEQWLAEINTLMPGVKCVIYNNSLKSPHTSFDICIVVINTARDKDAEFMSHFGFMILDEAHEYFSKCNKQILWLSQQIGAVMGLSATPAVRHDGMDKFITKFIGEPIRADSIPNCSVDDVNFTGRVDVIKYYGDPEHSETVANGAGVSSAMMTISNIVQDKYRLKLIATEVAELLKKHCVMVFAELRDILPEIRAALLEHIAETDIYVPELEILRGGSTVADMDHAKQSRVVLTTYGYSRRGVSLRDMTALVLATPRKSGMEQIIGRILRRGSDESIERKIVDIVDMNSGLKTQFAFRRKVYEKKMYPINTRVVKIPIAAPTVAATTAPIDDDEFDALCAELE